MAYINAEKSKQIRENLKREFSSKDGWSFSVSIANYMKLYVKILKAPIDFGVEKYQSVYYKSIDRYFKGEAATALNRIAEICNEGNFDHSDSMSDYFHVGWYFDLTIGDYEKPFQFVEKKNYQFKPVEVQPATTNEGELYGESLESLRYWFDKSLIETELNDTPGCTKTNNQLENKHIKMVYTYGSLEVHCKDSGFSQVFNDKMFADKVFLPDRLNDIFFEYYYFFNEETTLKTISEITDTIKIE